jgi:hypothetical protein
MPVDVDIYRNESLIELGVYRVDPGDADEMVDLVRAKWALLREKRLAGDYPVDVLRDEGGDTVKVMEFFRWRTLHDRAEAEVDQDCIELQGKIDALSRTTHERETFTEAIRGFNRNFPSMGGNELLRGVCSCNVSIDGLLDEFPLSVKNGMVLMHRSPGTDFDGDGRNEMYLSIQWHGGDLEDPAGIGGSIRVTQNFDVPNNGIVKSHGLNGTDFPGTAIWRVGWQLITPAGRLLTDPSVPLIFGPATVEHYPPVGTHFHSPTGPVALIHADSGRTVGSLTPGELTAFDIIVTRDDEVPATIVNTPDDILDVLAEWTAKEAVPTN